MTKIISVVGARPNFMKIAPFIHTINDYNQSFSSSSLKTHHSKLITHKLVHTGQHYDEAMSETFFKALGIPEPDINLGIGSGTHAEQVGYTMIAFEKVLEKEKPDWVVIVGDVNATLSCSVAAKKFHIKVCHIEAGLRSGDKKMPEEINRLVTDRLSDLLLTADKLSIENLRKEGIPEKKIKFTGNIMIDTLEANRGKAYRLSIEKIIQDHLLPGQLTTQNSLLTTYTLMTLHRPSNVDDQTIFTNIINLLTEELSKETPIIWPIHPRSEKQLKKFGLWNKVINRQNLILLYPVGYHEMLRLNMDAKIMLTDSGGLQEECTVLGTPCLTMRWNTERPITLRKHNGASVLVGNNIERIRKEFFSTLQQDQKPERPELWDGNTAKRCLNAILNYKI